MVSLIKDNPRAYHNKSPFWQEVRRLSDAGSGGKFEMYVMELAQRKGLYIPAKTLSIDLGNNDLMALRYLIRNRY